MKLNNKAPTWGSIGKADFALLSPPNSENNKNEVKGMRISKCKKCKLHRLDTLADGSLEHYCYPPIMLGAIAFSIPCLDRNPKDCKKILKESTKER